MVSRSALAAVAALALATPAAAQTPASPTAAGAATAPPPLAAYARLPAVEDVSVSPDGARVAYVATSGEARVVRIRTFAGEPIAILNAGDRRVRFLEWADPDHLLVVTRQSLPATQTVAGTIPKQEVNVAVSYSVPTRKSVTLLNDTPGVVAAINSNPQPIKPDGRSAVFVLALNVDKRGRAEFEYAPYRVDLDTGRGTQLGPGSLDAERWLMRPSGEPAARTLRPDGQWRLQVRKGRDWADLARTTSGAPSPVLLGFGRDGRSLLVSGGPEGQEGLFEVSPDTGAWGPALPGVLGAPPSYYDRSTDGRLLAAVGRGGRYEPIIYDPGLKTAWAVARKSFPGKRLQLVDISDDRRTLILGVSDHGGPPAAYVLDLDAKRADLIGEDYPDLPPEGVALVREIAFTAGDGTPLTGVLTRPKGPELRGAPLVVLAWSFARIDYDPEFDWMAQALASRGYTVLQVDSRDAAPGRERGGDGQLGRKLQTDLSDGVRHLASTGQIDPARVCIVGAGRGGYSALAGVTVQTGVYRCAVSIDGLADLRAELSRLKEGSGGSAQARAAAFARLIGVDGPADPRLQEVSPVRQARNGRAPVLLLHGEDDAVVPIAQSRAMLSALKGAGRTADLVTLPLGDNDLTRETARIRALTETVAFLEKHNPPR